MRAGKELLGKPIFSITDGIQLGAVKDIYLDLKLGALTGIYIGSEGILNRKVKYIPREEITVLGVDAVLVTGSEVDTDHIESPEVETWLRREDVKGRDINTAGGTKVGTLGDILFDEESMVVGFTLAKVFVAGPVAESRTVLKSAVLKTGGKEGVITIDLAKAEQPESEPTKPAEPTKAKESDNDSQKEEPAEDSSS